MDWSKQWAILAKIIRELVNSLNTSQQTGPQAVLYVTQGINLLLFGLLPLSNNDPFCQQQSIQQPTANHTLIWAKQLMLIIIYFLHRQNNKLLEWTH